MASEQPLDLREGRFARLEAIQWWDQSLVRQARLLLIGAGALGNEVLKNLALLGVGHVVVVDSDHIETSNLCRSVLFREADEGQPKATRAAAAAEALYAGTRVTPLVGNALSDVGLGVFRWAEVVLGAVDNREARVYVNSACARVGTPWIDGGIEVLQGLVRGVAPPRTACYECTMGEADWALLTQQRSCSLLARRAAAQSGTPTTPLAASVIGALQVAEAIKCLHGLDTLWGKGYVLEALHHASYLTSYPVNPQCPWHDEPAPVEMAADLDAGTPLRVAWERGRALLGEVEALELGRELVEALDCPTCGRHDTVFAPALKLAAEQLVCPRCRVEMAPSFLHSLAPGSPLLERTPAELGLPPWDIVWLRHGDRCVGLEFGGDRERVLGSSS